jgi:hypothetical protein
MQLSKLHGANGVRMLKKINQYNPLVFRTSSLDIDGALICCQDMLGVACTFGTVTAKSV